MLTLLENASTRRTCSVSGKSLNLTFATSAGAGSLIPTSDFNVSMNERGLLKSGDWPSSESLGCPFKHFGGTRDLDLGAHQPARVEAVGNARLESKHLQNRGCRQRQALSR